MKIDINNDFPTFVHLSPKVPEGWWQLSVTNFGPGYVSVDAGMINLKLIEKYINGKQEPVFVYPGCQAVFTKNGSEYLWDQHPITLHGGLLINEHSCKKNPEQRPFTQAELADAADNGIRLQPRAVPSWVGMYEPQLINCIRPGDIPQAQKDFSDLRRAIETGDKAAFPSLIERFSLWRGKMVNTPFDLADGCRKTEASEKVLNHLYSIRDFGRYETPN
jgi:hypothetical protein